MKQRRKTRFRGSKPSHGLDRPNPRSSFIGHSSAKFFSGIRSEGARNAKTRSTQPPEETTPTGLLPALQRCAKLRVAFSLHGISTAGGTTPSSAAEAKAKSPPCGSSRIPHLPDQVLTKP